MMTISIAKIQSKGVTRVQNSMVSSYLEYNTVDNAGQEEMMICIRNMGEVLHVEMMGKVQLGLIMCTKLCVS